MYAIKSNEVFGRYLVASRDLKPGEVILREHPAMIGSQIEANHICFKCSKSLRTNVRVCRECGLATLCSECTDSRHNEAECKALKTFGLKAMDIINDPQIIMPLRCLTIRRYDEDLWGEIMKLEAHIEERKSTPIWKRHEITVENVMKKLNLINDDDIKEMLIQKICGILDVNTFELRPPNSKNMMVNNKDCLRGLYLKASLMAHDCVGNTHLSIDDDLEMTVIASLPILKGEIIFFNYTSCLKGTQDRRLHLKTGKYFDCKCKRCLDPTELQTHMSSVKCTKCKNGYVIPGDFSIMWKCQSCGVQQRGEMIQLMLNVAKEKIFDLDPSNLENAENLLKTLRLSLSENHYLILELKQNLIPIYEANIFNDRALCRKIEMCEDVLKILKVVEPGISRLQGIALYQLHSTKINLANKRYQERRISTENYVVCLQEAEENLVESMKHLIYEPKNSPEGRLLQNAFSDLKILRNTIKQLRGNYKLPKENDLFSMVTKKK